MGWPRVFCLVEGLLGVCDWVLVEGGGYWHNQLRGVFGALSGGLWAAGGAMCRGSRTLGFAVLSGIYGSSSSFHAFKLKSLNSFGNS